MLETLTANCALFIMLVVYGFFFVCVGLSVYNLVSPNPLETLRFPSLRLISVGSNAPFITYYYLFICPSKRRILFSKFYQLTILLFYYF